MKFMTFGLLSHRLWGSLSNAFAKSVYDFNSATRYQCYNDNYKQTLP